MLLVITCAAHRFLWVTSMLSGCPSPFSPGWHCSPMVSLPAACGGGAGGLETGRAWALCHSGDQHWMLEGASAAPAAARSLQLKEGDRNTDKTQPWGDLPKSNPAWKGKGPCIYKATTDKRVMAAAAGGSCVTTDEASK